MIALLLLLQIVAVAGSCCKDLTCETGHCCVYLTIEEAVEEVETCCNDNQRCTKDGCMENAECSNLAKDTCLSSSSCSWCCTTNSCENSGGFSSCSESIATPQEQCQDPCNEHTTCDTCTSKELCGWCCGSGLCMKGDKMDKNPEPCLADFIGLATYSNNRIRNLDAQCSSCVFCDLKPEIVIISSSDSVNVAVVIVPIVAVFVIILVIVITTIIYKNRKAKEARVSAHLAAQSRIAMAEKLKPTKAKKHGFGEPVDGQERNPPTFSKPDYGEDAEEEDFTCIGCYDEPKEVLYLPCKHHCYCRTCAIRHENIHIEKRNRVPLADDPPVSTLPLCSLCRNPIECMIYTEAVNSPPGLRERRASTPPSLDCNTPDGEDKPEEVSLSVEDDDEQRDNDPF